VADDGGRTMATYKLLESVQLQDRVVLLEEVKPESSNDPVPLGPLEVSSMSRHHLGSILPISALPSQSCRIHLQDSRKLDQEKKGKRWTVVRESHVVVKKSDKTRGLTLSRKMFS